MWNWYQCETLRKNHLSGKIAGYLLLLWVSLYAQAVSQITTGDISSDFESGFVGNVQLVGADSIAFEAREDIPTPYVSGWFYFSISGNTGRTVTLFLTNPDPRWQDEDHNPFFSTDKVNWQPLQDIWMQGASEDTLVFRQPLEADTVWFAQCIPFTLTRMTEFIDTLSGSQYVKRDTIGNSVHGRPIELVHLNDSSVISDQKATVWLISRQHPMESPSSYVLKGILSKINYDSAFHEHWLRHFDLKVVPIVNVDGVVEGYSRYNANGIDLNRNWQPSTASEEPEVRAVHEAIDNYIAGGGSIDLFVDLHSAWNFYDFGYRIDSQYCSDNFYENQDRFFDWLTNMDSHQYGDMWDFMGASVPTGGPSAQSLFEIYGLNGFITENPWSRRKDMSHISVSSLEEQGAQWADALFQYLCCHGERGDVNDMTGPGGPVDVADISYLVDYLYRGGNAPVCSDEGNVDGLSGPGGPIDVADLTYLIDFVFRGGVLPANCPGNR